MVGESGSAGKKESLNIFENEITRIQDAIEARDTGRPSHIAVIADPFAGHEVIMQEIKSANPDIVSHIPLFNVVKGKDFLSVLYGTKDVILMERCHFLALRKIGGFAVLDAFLDAVASSDKLLITGWNSFSWSYLNAVRHIETFFPMIVELPRLSSVTLKTLILSRYEKTIRFVDDTERKEEPFLSTEHRRFSLPVIDRSVEVPWPHINPGALHAGRKQQTTIDVEDAVFEKINRIAEGNYGVALKIWEQSLEDSVVNLSSIPEIPCAIHLDINESFLLNSVLSMESINITDLREIAGPEIDLDQTLYRLTNLGLIEEVKGYYQVKAEALNCVISHLRRIRMVW